LITENCGNCDLQNPPAFFDGTIIAQKSIIRHQSITRGRALPVIVDFYEVQKNIFTKSVSKFKTYGIGQDLSWYEPIPHSINQFRILRDFHQQNKIRLTSFAKVLFDGEKYNNCAKTFDGEK
jgi:ATP-dependent DNA helicase RecQ